MLSFKKIWNENEYENMTVFIYEDLDRFHG